MKLKDIKNSFDKREIAPSADSWQRLSQQLDHADKKKKRPFMYWICAAAALIVIALMVSQTSFFTTDHAPEMNSFTTTEKDADTIKSINEDAVVLDKSPIVEETAITNSDTIPELKSAVVISKTKAPKTATPKSQLAIEKITISPVQVSLDAMASNEINNLTLVQETDLLLKEAFAKAESQPIVTKSIKPDQLLRETEWDLEADRRNRVNNGLKSGFGVLKIEAFALIGVDR
jgi:hypothetical protein